MKIVYVCNNINKEHKTCEYRGSNEKAKYCPRCGGWAYNFTWFK